MSFTKEIQQLKRIVKDSNIIKHKGKKIIYYSSTNRIIEIFNSNHSLYLKFKLNKPNKIKEGWYYLSSFNKKSIPISFEEIQKSNDDCPELHRSSWSDRNFKYATRKSTDGLRIIKDYYTGSGLTWQHINNGLKVGKSGLDIDTIKQPVKFSLHFYLDKNENTNGEYQGYIKEGQFIFASINPYAILLNNTRKIDDFLLLENNKINKIIIPCSTIDLNLAEIDIDKDEYITLFLKNNIENEEYEYLVIKGGNLELTVLRNYHHVCWEIPIAPNLICHLPRYENLLASNSLSGWAQKETNNTKMLLYHCDRNIYYLDEDYKVTNHQKHDYDIAPECKGKNNWIAINPVLLESFSKIRGAELRIDKNPHRSLNGIVINSKTVDSVHDYRIIGCVKGINLNCDKENLVTIKNNILEYKKKSNIQ